MNLGRKQSFSVRCKVCAATIIISAKQLELQELVKCAGCGEGTPIRAAEAGKR